MAEQEKREDLLMKVYNHEASIMIYELADTSLVIKLFGDWSETMIYSCVQKVMGKLLCGGPA